MSSVQNIGEGRSIVNHRAINEFRVDDRAANSVGELELDFAGNSFTAAAQLMMFLINIKLI